MKKRRSTTRIGTIAGTIGGMVAALAMAPAASAGTDELCAAQAQGVPGPQPKHPEWWNPALSASQRETRWTGATSIYDVGSVAPNLGSGRVIWDEPSQRLFFQLEVDGDPTIDDDEDIVMLAVSDPTGTAPDLYVQFQPLRNCSPVSNCTGLGAAVSSSSVQYSQATGGTSITWSTLSTTNPSSQWTVHHPWVEVRPLGSGSAAPYRWTLRFALEIPVEVATGEAWPNLRTYGNAVMYMQGPTSGTAVELPLLCDPSSPTSNDCLVFSSGITPLPAGLPVSNMGTVWSHVTTGDLSACDGVELLRPLVGSDHDPTSGTVPGTSVAYDLPGHRIPKFTGARLRAGFRNDTAASLAAGDVDAEFRIANWGLQWSTWSSATWSFIDSASLGGTVSAGAYAGAAGQGAVETASPWIPSASGLPLTNDHQCMHVKLTTTTGGVNFKVDSVYRNMDLVNASTFRRPIDLDMSGREPAEGQEGNDVYLLVSTANMPSVELCDEAGQQLRGCAEGGPLVLETKHGEPVPDDEIEWDHAAAEEAGMEPAVFEKGEQHEGGDEKKRRPVGLAELPRYLVHGLVDTGGFINLPGAPQTPVLQAFSSYGYYVQHEGEPSHGFEHYVHVAGSEPVEGVPGLYRVHVPEHGVVAMSNTVRVIDGVQEPCEDPPLPHERMSEDEEVVQTLAKAEAGLAGELKHQVVTEPQFGCEPPPLREPCALGECAPHNPLGYVEGSRYVGEWSEEAIAAVVPADQRPDSLRGASAHEQDAASTGDDALEGELDPIGGATDGCCTQASVDPHAGTRGAAKVGALVMVLLLLRRRRRRHERAA